MEQNNFKMLETLEIASRRHDKEESRSKLQSNIRLFDLAGDLADIFLNRIPVTISQLLKAEKEKNRDS